MPPHPWWAPPHWPAKRQRGRSQVERDGEPRLPESPPASLHLISNSRIIYHRGAAGDECELGAQLDFVLSCSLPLCHPPPPRRCLLSGAGRECAKPCWDLSQAKAVSASMRETECAASWGLCRRCSFQEIITLCPFKLAQKIEH